MALVVRETLRNRLRSKGIKELAMSRVPAWLLNEIASSSHTARMFLEDNLVHSGAMRVLMGRGRTRT